MNSGATIRKTLESLMAQKFRDFEHIVVDGGSKDNTVSVLREFEDQYDLQWVSEPDEGIADALNKGLCRSRGRYVLVVQADDCLSGPSILERVYGSLKEERFDIHCFPVILDHPVRGHVLLKPIPIPWWNHFKTIFRHQGAFVHRRVFGSIGQFRAEFSIALDYDFFYRALQSGCTVCFERKPPITIMGGQGISANQDYLTKRLTEEARVQDLNEVNPLWKSLQQVFRHLYVPYKVRLLPLIRKAS